MTEPILSLPQPKNPPQSRLGKGGGRSVKRNQRLVLAIVSITNLVLWIIPSEVVTLIAKERPVLLGRYSKQHFFWAVGVAVGSLIVLYIQRAPPATAKRRVFQLAAVGFFLFPALVVMDLALRSADRLDYVRDRVAYRHPAGLRLEQPYEDRPEAARSYPNAPPGYPTVPCRLTTDARGFRNRTNRDQADIVVLGDSFAEGSSVSDEDAWPVLLEERTGRSVYNLGMSGYDPMHYLASLEEFGFALQPKTVICMLYEGNDFRSEKSDWKERQPSISKRFKAFLDGSPVLQGVERGTVSVLGRINSRGTVPQAEILDWLPLSIPNGAQARRYAFAPKQLRDLMDEPERFSLDKHWLNPRGQLERMSELCKQRGCRFVVVFAPTKAHVVMPLVVERLSAEKVRTFLAMDFKGEWPRTEELLGVLSSRIEGREGVVRTWCEKNAIAFLSLTPALRAAVDAGRQAYYTYDQHWTPEGHAVTAAEVQRFLSAERPPSIPPS